MNIRLTLAVKGNHTIVHDTNDFDSIDELMETLEIGLYRTMPYTETDVMTLHNSNSVIVVAPKDIRVYKIEEI